MTLKDLAQVGETLASLGKGLNATVLHCMCMCCLRRMYVYITSYVNHTYVHIRSLGEIYIQIVIIEHNPTSTVH